MPYEQSLSKKMRFLLLLAILSLFHATKARVYGTAHFTGYVPRKRSMDQFGWFHHGLKNLIEGRDKRTDTV